MLTAMTEEDWAVALVVFEACRSRRGDKGRNNRKFLEVMRYFTLHNVTCRALPAEFGPWTSVWKRFWRLRETGELEAFFDTLANLSRTAHFVQMFDSIIVRAHVSAAGAKGGKRRKRSAAREAKSQAKFTSKVTSMDCLSPSI